MPNLAKNCQLLQAPFHRSIPSMSNGTSKIINSLRRLPRSVSSRMRNLPSRLRSWPKLRPMLSPRVAPSLPAAAIPLLTAAAIPLLTLATTMLRSEPRARAKMKTIMVLLRSMPRSREKRLFSLSLNLKSMLSLRAAANRAPHHLLLAIAHPLLATTMLRLEPRARARMTTSKTLPRSMPRLRLRLSKPSKRRPSSTLPTSWHRLALRTPSCSWLSWVTPSRRSRLV